MQRERSFGIAGSSVASNVLEWHGNGGTIPISSVGNPSDDSVYEVYYQRAAKRARDRLDRTAMARIDRAISALRFDPYHAGDVKQLSGELSKFLRLRIGGWRMLFIVDEAHRCLVIYDIAPRGNVY